MKAFILLGISAVFYTVLSKHESIDASKIKSLIGNTSAAVPYFHLTHVFDRSTYIGIEYDEERPNVLASFTHYTLPGPDQNLIQWAFENTHENPLEAFYGTIRSRAFRSLPNNHYYYWEYVPQLGMVLAIQKTGDQLTEQNYFTLPEGASPYTVHPVLSPDRYVSFSPFENFFYMNITSTATIYTLFSIQTGI